MDTTQAQPHHPSTDELQRFRWAIATADLGNRPYKRPPLGGYGIPGPFAEPSRPGAWPSEVRDGIGMRGWDQYPDPKGPDGYNPRALVPFLVDPRAEARVLRSRSYERLLEEVAGELEWADSQERYHAIMDHHALDAFAPRRQRWA